VNWIKVARSAVEGSCEHGNGPTGCVACVLLAS
jgi:hypothetical protein